MDKNIMQQQITNIKNPFETMVSQVFQNFPKKQEPASKKVAEQNRIDYEKKISKYLAEKTVLKGDITKVIHNASFVASSQPDTSFQNLISILLNDKGEPNSNYFQNISTVDLNDPYQKATFQYLVDTLICFFLHELLLASTNIKKEECKSIYSNVINIWYPKQQLMPFYQELRLLNGKTWAHIFYILSFKIPEIVADDLIIKRMPSQSDSDISIQVYLTLSQYVYIGNESKLDYDKLPKKFKDLESIAQRSKVDGPIHAPAMEFFTNLMGYLLTNHQEYRSDEFILQLSDIAKKYTNEKGYVAGSAYSLRALLYRFTKHKKMKLDLKQYYEKYIQSRFIPELAKYHVESCIYFVRGENYAAHCQLEISEENYKWRYPPNEKDKMDYIFRQLTISHGDFLTNSQEELGEFFTQFACNDFKDFVSNYLPILMKNVFSTNNSYSLFIMAHNILSPMSKFSEYAKNGKDQDSIKKLKEEILKLAQQTINIKDYPTSNFGFYSIISFIESLNLSSAKEANDESTIQAKMNSCIHNLPTNSVVQSTYLQIARSTFIKEVKRWSKNMDKNLAGKLFENVSKTSKYKTAEIQPFSNDKYIEGISILPFLEISKPIIQLLVNCLYTSHCHAGSIALRTLQVFVHLDKKWLNPILYSLCTPIPPTVEHLILQLQAISLIVQSGLFVHSEINNEVQQLLFKSLIFAICSNISEVRSYALETASKVSTLCQKKSPDLFNFIQTFSDVIDIRLQNLCFSYASFNLDLDMSEIETISFATIAKNSYDNFYLFALESFSNALRDKSEQADLDFLRTSLTNAIQQVKLDTIMKVNLSIILAGIAQQPIHSNYFIKNMDNFSKTIDANKTIRPFAFLTFYTAFDPKIGISVHAPLLKSDDPFFMNVLTFILRVYITESNEQYDYVSDAVKKLLKTYKKKSNKKDWLDDKLSNSKQPDELNKSSILFNKPKDWPLIDEENLDFINSSCNFLITLNILYRELFKKEAQFPKGPYARPERISFELDAMPSSDDTLMFAYLINLASIEKDSGLNYDLVQLAKSSLSSFIKTYTIPSTISNLLRPNLQKISKISFSSIEMILNSFFIDVIPDYLNNSYTDHTFFKAIAYQFYRNDSMDEHYKQWTQSLKGQMSESDDRFATVTYLNTGILLAFAFFNLCSLQPDERLNGFTVLLNIALGSSLIKLKKDDPTIDVTKVDTSDFHELIHCLAKLKTLISVQHPQLTETLLVKISRIVNRELGFCTEQFIKTSFELIQPQGNLEGKTRNEVFLHVTVPWVDNLIFNRAEDTVLKDCDKEFSCLSTFSFFQMLISNIITVPLNRSHVLLLDKILQQPCDGSISTLEFFIVTLYKLYQLNANSQIVLESSAPKSTHLKISQSDSNYKDDENSQIDYKRRCIDVIVYLLGQDKENVIALISKYMSFKAWFYYQIQLKKIDTTFDIDKFMRDIAANDDLAKAQTQGKGGAKKSNEIDHIEVNEESDEDFYLTIIEFTAEIFNEFIKVNRESIRSVDYLIVLYCIINYEALEKSEILLTLLSNICGIQKYSMTETIRRFSSVMKSTIMNAIPLISGADGSEPSFPAPLQRSSTLIRKSGTFEEVDLASNDVSIIEKLTSVPMQNLATALDYIEDLKPEHLQRFCDEALRWAIGCGDIDHGTAIKASKFFLMYANSIDEDTIQIIIRSIYIMSSVLAERIDPNYNKGNAAIFTAMQNSPPDYNKAIQYITLLLNILYKGHEWTKKPNEDTFYLALSLLQFRETIAMPIVTVSLKIVIDYLEKERPFIDEITKKDGGLPNLLRPLISMNHNESSIILAYKLISVMAINYPKSLIEDDDGTFFSLSTINSTSSSNTSSVGSDKHHKSATATRTKRSKIDSQSGLSLLVLSLMPYMFINQHEESVKMIMNSLSEQAKEMGFKELATEFKSPLSGSPEEFSKSILSKLSKVKINSDDLERAIAFFSTISQTSALDTMFGPIVSICTVLLSNPEFKPNADSFHDIGFKSINDKDTNRNGLNLNFLAALTRKKGTAYFTKRSKALKNVPELRLKTLIDLSSWAPTDGVDPFENVRDIPPLSIISIDYIGCSIQKPISCAVQQVKVEPFSSWTTMMFRAESLQNQMDNLMDNMMDNMMEKKEIKVDSDKGKRLLDIFKKAIVINPDENFDDDNISEAVSQRAASQISKIKLETPSNFRLQNIIDDIKSADLMAVPTDNTNPYALDQWASRMENKIFSPTEFVPSQDEINNIGSDILTGIDSLSFFPSERF